MYVDRSMWTGSAMRDRKKVVVNENGPWVRVMSIDPLRPRSALNGPSRVSRARPAASVSSVSGVDPKNPVPADNRVDQLPRRNNDEMRGLKNQPYALW